VAEGFGVESRERFSDRLKAGLGAQDQFRDIDVMNFAIAGYATVDEITILRERAIAYRPDLVIVQFGWNDLARNLELSAPRPASSLTRPDEGPVSEHTFDMKRLLQQQSVLYLAVAERWNAFRLAQGVPSDLLATVLRTREDEWIDTIQAMKQLKAIIATELAATKVLVAYFPLQVEVLVGNASLSSTVAARLHSVALELDFCFLDLTPPLRSSATKSLFLDDVHPTSNGHSVIATALQAAVPRCMAAWPSPNRNGG
jgi:lysophospholipase L1-like esterase